MKCPQRDFGNPSHSIFFEKCEVENSLSRARLKTILKKMGFE